MRALIAATLLTALAGCASPSAEQQVTVFAAASLAPAFQPIATAYEQQHPGTRVRLHLAGSRTLVTQLDQGAPADVLATADLASMAQARANGVLAGRSVPFAHNAAVVAVPAGNPGGLSRAADLADPAVQLVVCAVPVPCGVAAKTLLADLGVDRQPVSEETSVAGVVGKVAAGEADAGIVYATDLANRADLRQLPGDAAAPTTTYPIAELAGAGPIADSFIDFVLADPGQQLLAEAGFGPA